MEATVASAGAPAAASGPGMLLLARRYFRLPASLIQTLSSLLYLDVAFVLFQSVRGSAECQVLPNSAHSSGGTNPRPLHGLDRPLSSCRWREWLQVRSSGIC
jgi:hypothetical protein